MDSFPIVSYYNNKICLRKLDGFAFLIDKGDRYVMCMRNLRVLKDKLVTTQRYRNNAMKNPLALIIDATCIIYNNASVLTSSLILQIKIFKISVTGKYLLRSFANFINEDAIRHYNCVTNEIMANYATPMSTSFGYCFIYNFSFSPCYGLATGVPLGTEVGP